MRRVFRTMKSKDMVSKSILSFANIHLSLPPSCKIDNYLMPKRSMSELCMSFR